MSLFHWGWVTHICISKLTIFDSDNGLSLGRCQAIIWTSAEILLIGSIGTNFSEILMEIHIFSFKKMHVKILSVKWGPFCLSLNMFKQRLWHHFIESKSFVHCCKLNYTNEWNNNLSSIDTIWYYWKGILHLFIFVLTNMIFSKVGSYRWLSVKLQ